MSPIGPVAVPQGERVDGRSVDASSTALHLAGASEGFSHALSGALKSVSVLDAYGRDFSADLSGQVTGERRTADIGSRVEARIAKGGQSSRAEFQTETGVYQAFDFGPEGGIERARLGYRSAGLELIAYREQTRAPASRLGDIPMLSYAEQPMVSKLDAHSGVAMTHAFKDGLSLSVNGTQGTRGGYTETALSGGEIEFTQTISPHWSVNAGFARFDERDGALGLTGAGALSSAGEGVTSLPSVGVRYERDDLSLFARYQRGEASAQFSDSLIESLDATLERAAFGGSLRFGGNETQSFAFVVSTPLHASSGQADLRIPVGRSDDGRVRYENRRADLSPESTPIDFELGYRRVMSEHRSLTVNALAGKRSGDDQHALTLTVNQRF